MKEAVFVKRNTDKWREYESTPTNNPDQLTERYVELTDDLSYSQTFYPNATVTKYLNGLAAQFHQKLFSNRREDRNRIKTFWITELPTLMYEVRFKLLYAFLFFLVAFLLGWVSTAHDDTFIRLILGDDYVNETLENIKKGDPLAIYKSQDQANMFLAITFNNIKVAFVAFALGLLFSAGTIFILLQNGIMLGAFQFFFFARGLLLASLLKIWIHGTLEISAIVIAGCAGLVVGNSLLFPKTFSRLDSFKKGVKKGLKIVVGLVPIFITAGFLESFVTRLTLPIPISCLIIGISAFFIIWYFVWYPYRLNQQKESTKTSNP